MSYPSATAAAVSTATWSVRRHNSRVADPYPDWIRIQRLCGSGSIFGIRIPDPDPGARKLRNFSGKTPFLVIFLKTSPLKRYEIAYGKYFFNKILMNNTVIFYLL
jgi:hypothetical protein